LIWQVVIDAINFCLVLFSGELYCIDVNKNWRWRRHFYNTCHEREIINRKSHEKSVRRSRDSNHGSLDCLSSVSTTPQRSLRYFQSCHIYGQKIELVNSFKYLGVNFFQKR
jgi:hypothetical protein